MPTTADFRNGMNIVLEGNLYTIVEFQHVKPGKGGAFVRTKLKNFKTGAVLDRTFRAGERIEEARIERRKMQYLYQADDFFYFMDVATFEQISLSRDLVGQTRIYMKENEIVTVQMYDEKVIGIELPLFVELTVSKTEPGIRGDTVTPGNKPATLETDAVIQVPLFINIGDILKIDTRTGEYIERM